MMPPGTRALAFASRWFDPATVHRTFEPLVADWQREWLDAPRSRRGIVHARGVVAFCIATMISIPAIVRTRAPKPLTDQIARRVTIGAAIGTGILMMPFLTNGGPLWHRALTALVVVPQGLTLAFPFALLPGVDAIRRFDGVDSHTARATASKLAALGLMFVFVCHGWVTPAANQVYREMMLAASIKAQGDAESIKHFERARPRPAPGVREMSNSELLAGLMRAGENEPGTYRFAMATSLQREINNRAALAALPVVLLWRRWRALDLPARRWFSARHSLLGAAGMVVVFGALTAISGITEKAYQLPAGSGPWLTLTLLTTLGITRVWLVERSVARA
jgi:hypothetical protein